MPKKFDEVDELRQTLLAWAPRRPSEEKCEDYKRRILELFPKKGRAWKQENTLERESVKANIVIPFWTQYFLEELWLNGHLERRTDKGYKPPRRYFRRKLD